MCDIFIAFRFGIYRVHKKYIWFWILLLFVLPIIVGSVADNVDQPLPQKIFHARIELDSAAIQAEERCFVPIPQISSFLDEEGTDRMEEIIRENYYRIKEEVVEIVEREIRRIENDPDLAGLLPKKK